MNINRKIVANSHKLPRPELQLDTRCTPIRPFQTYVAPFVSAAGAGNLEYLQLILKRLGEEQIKILVKIAYESRTAFHAACGKNKVKVMIFLFQFGVDIEGRCGETGLTPLFCAVAGQATDAARWLVQNGAKKDTPTKFGKTPYDLAVRRHLIEMLNIFRTTH